MSTNTKTIKATVGEIQMEFVGTLKEMDKEKTKLERQKAMLKALMEWMADDCEENNESMSNENVTK